MQMCLDLKEAIEGAGISVDIVSTGETWTYDIAADLPGVTEVQGGTYLSCRPLTATWTSNPLLPKSSARSSAHRALGLPLAMWKCRP